MQMVYRPNLGIERLGTEAVHAVNSCFLIDD